MTTDQSLVHKSLVLTSKYYKVVSITVFTYNVIIGNMIETATLLP